MFCVFADWILNLLNTWSRHSSKAHKPGCILNILEDNWTTLLIDSLGVLVIHELVSTRRYRSPRVAYPPHLRNASMTCCSCVYFFFTITTYISKDFRWLYTQAFSTEFSQLPKSAGSRASSCSISWLLPPTHLINGFAFIILEDLLFISQKYAFFWLLSNFCTKTWIVFIDACRV